MVSLHTIHHLPLEDHLTAYEELYRVLTPGSSAVVVNGWKNPPVERWAKALRRLTLKLIPEKATPKENFLQAAALPSPRPGWWKNIRQQIRCGLVQKRGRRKAAL